VGTALSAKETLLKRRRQAKIDRQLRNGEKIDSSFVNSLVFDPINGEGEPGEVYVHLGDTLYTFHQVPSLLFENWWEGKASCHTDDETGRMRWWPTKTPSLGAFFNQHIRNHYNYSRVM
jgi:hypothetical protein